MAGSDAVLKVTADTSQASRALGELQKALGTLAGLSIAQNLSSQFIQITSAAQEMTNKLIFATGSVQQANTTFGLLAATAQKTGSNLGGTVDLFQKLAMSATFAGSSEASLASVTENFNKTLQISGASGQSAAAALYQFAQAMQKGSLNGDEFRTIAETNGYLLKVLGKELNLSQTELRQWAQDGKLSAEVIAKALINSKDIAQDYGKTVRTIPQAFENFETSITLALKRFDDATNISGVLAGALDTLSNNAGVAVGALAGMAAGVGALTVALIGLRTAMITTGLGALFVAIGAGVGYMAQKMGLFGDEAKTATDNTKGQTKTVNETNDALNKGLVITHQRNQQALDLDKTLKQHIGSMQAATAIELQSNGYRNIGLEVEKAVALEKEKYKKTGEAMLPAMERELALATQNKILAEERGSVMKTIADLELQVVTNSILDSDQRRIQADLDKMKLQYSEQTYNKYKDQVASLLHQNQLIETQVKLKDAYRETPTRSEVGNIGSSMLSNQTFLGVYTQYKKNLEVLAELKGNGLVSEQEYANLYVQIQKERNDRVLALDQQNAENRMKIAGVTNQAIIDSVKAQQANVTMIQNGGIQGFQGMLGAIDNVMASMSAQNRKAFEAHKALATAQAVISTYQAAAEAIAFPPGPPLSFIYVAGAIAAGMAQVAAIQSQTYSGKALGGSVKGNTPYVVGEKGPEMFVPAGSGTIVPNSELRGGGGPVNVNFTIVANDSQGFDTLLTQRRGMITQMVNDAMLERGQRII